MMLYCCTFASVAVQYYILFPVTCKERMLKQFALPKLMFTSCVTQHSSEIACLMIREFAAMSLVYLLN